jgi:hypothetical protein
MLARERDDGPVRALALNQIFTDGLIVLDCALDAARNHHRPSLPADLPERQHLLMEVVHHDLGF